MEIVLLYYFYKTTEIEGAAWGAHLYFTKPINTNLPELTIKNIFEQRQKLKGHYLKHKDTEP